MAFTGSQKVSICKILQVTPVFLDDQIAWLGERLTSVIENSIVAEITRWTTAGVEFVRIHPNERNFGAEINPEDEKGDIRANIAYLLEREDWVHGNGSSGSSGSWMERG